MELIAPSPSSSRPVATWIMIGVAMMLIQVVLGGITRLTGSGLSITEWDVVTGFLPPMNEQRWMEEFNKYRQTPQFHYLNMDFTLSDFKFIFFWEWLHRFWARLIAIVFAIPFIVFLFQGRFTKDMMRTLLLLFVFGALQGAIGWIMVMSGLTGDAIYVKPTKLALHFVFALGLVALSFWVGLKWLLPDKEGSVASGLRRITGWMIALVFIQFVFGALMAGHKAANAAPTWPTINEEWIPANLFIEKPLLFNLVDNKITIHFIHRLLAYALAIVTIIWTIRAYKKPAMPRLFTSTRWMPLALIIVQVLLGIFSLSASRHIVPGRWGTFEWLAQLHQVTGMLFLLSLVWMYYLVRKNSLHALAGMR